MKLKTNNPEKTNNKIIILEFISSIGIRILLTTRAFSNVIFDNIPEDYFDLSGRIIF